MIRYIAIHHSGGTKSNPLATGVNTTFHQINEAHKQRWPDFPSELNPNWYVGYNFLLFRDGNLVQTRLIGEETAAQVGHNLDSVSICLIGNFTKGVDIPTFEQKTTLRNLLVNLLTTRQNVKIKQGCTFDLNASRIVAHRNLQLDTECFGSSLPDSFGRDLVGEYVTLLQKLLIHFTTLLNLFKSSKLGNKGRACNNEIL